MENKINQTIELKDGRKLGFAEYGDSQAKKTVIYFNGSGGSRLEYPLDKNILSDLGIRFVATDRPGHGLSSPQPDRKLLDWPDDISQLADHLNAEKFYVLGWSAGGPHALACAYKLPKQVIAAAIFGGLAPSTRPNPYKGLSFLFKLMNFIARTIPSLSYFTRRLNYKMMKGDPDKVGEKFLSILPEEDKNIVEIPEIQKMLFTSLQQGFKQCWKGVAKDDIVINSDWNFKLEDIKPRVDIWQGDKDKNVPIYQGEYQNEKIPNSTFTILENEAHFALLTNWGNVLQKLISN